MNWMLDKISQNCSIRVGTKRLVSNKRGQVQVREKAFKVIYETQVEHLVKEIPRKARMATRSVTVASDFDGV